MVERFEKFSFALFEITRYWYKISAEEMKPYGLKGPHATYLSTLYKQEDGITAPKLADLCGKDKADVSRSMAIMEEKGLVIKEAVGKNKYRGLLKLTDKGREAAEHVRERIVVAVKIAGRGLSDEQRENFYAALSLITYNMRDLNQNGLPE